MILVILAALLVFLSAQAGTLFVPVYWVRSKLRGTSMPEVHTSFEFGIGNLLEMLKRFKEGTVAPKLMEDLDCKHRTRLFQAPFRWVVLTSDPENIKTVLSTKFKDYDLGPREDAMGYAFGSGIFMVSGERWKHSRNMLRPQFTRDQIAQLDSIVTHTQDLFKALDVLQNKQKYVDCQELFHQFTLDTSTEFLFGESLSSLAEVIGGEPVTITHNGRSVSAKQFVESYTYMTTQSARRMLLGPLRNVFKPKELDWHIERARILVSHYVQIALDRTAEGKDEETDKYVFSYGLAKTTRDVKTIMDQIFNILIAGRDTTAVTLTFITFFLANNPDVYAKLRSEVLEVFGTKEDPKKTTFEMLRTAKYLNAVINETLRLCPLISMNARWAVRDTIIPRGGGPNGDQPVLVPKGTSVGYRAFALHRDPAIWGPDANEFNPERWMQKQDIPSWAYIPFNGGPRICIGQQFALTELAFVTARLAQHYSKLEGDLPRSPQYDFDLTIKSRTPVKVRFSE